MEDGATASGGFQTANDAALDRPTGEGAAMERELARARERLAFYEGFDRLIQENIARSGDLLRQAAEQREAAIRDVEQARAELDRRRAEQRATLTGLAEDLLGLQRRVGDLTGRVMTAIDDLGANGPVMVPPPTLADAAPPPAPPSPPDALLADPSRSVALETTPLDPDLADPAPPRNDALDAIATAEPDAPPTPPAATTTVIAAETAASLSPTDAAPPSAPAAAWAPTAADSAPAAPAEPPRLFEAPPPDLTRTGSGATETPFAPDEAAREVAVVVHGVPRAAAALALQRHLVNLPQVEAVEAREYAAGVLRLHVLTRAPLALADLRGWDAGASLEPVNLLPDVVEVRLPSPPVTQS